MRHLAKNKRKTSLALLSTLSLSYSFGIGSAYAGEPLFSTFLENGEKQFKEEHFNLAIKQFDLALANSEHLSETSPQKLKLYKLLGSTFARTGEQAKAATYLEKVVTTVKEIQKKSKKPIENNLVLFEPMMLLATVYRNENKFAQSEALYKEAVQSFSGNSDLALVCQATTLFAMGTLYLEMNKPQEAETVLNTALQVREKSQQKKFVSLNGIYDALGRAYLAQDRLKEAETTLKKALEYAEEEKSPQSIAYTKANIATVYTARGEYKEARKLVEEAKTYLTNAHGEQSMQAANTYSAMARISLDEDKYEEAETWVDKALTAHTKVLGENNATIAGDLSKQVEILRNQGQYDKAEEVSRKALGIYNSTIGPNTVRTAEAEVNLAKVLIDSNDPKKLGEAEEHLNRAIKVFDDNGAIFDKAHAFCKVADIRKAQKQEDKMEKLLLEAAVLLEKDAANYQPALLSIYRSLAKHYLENNQPDLALTYTKKSVEVISTKDGADSAKLVPDLKRLIDVCSTKNDAAGAKEAQDKLNAILAKNPELKAAAQAAPVVRKQAGAVEKVRPVRNKWALVIGISNFADSDINLRYAAKDAIDFSNYLQSDGNFPKQNVKLLTDKDATRENIVKQLGEGWLGRRAGPDDLVVVYVSSHGSTSMDKADGVNFLVAYDTQPTALLSTGIPMQWFSQMIKEQVHSNRVVLILDVCHSGAATRGEGKKSLSRTNTFNPDDIPLGAGQSVICSSAPEQVSWESKTYPNSVFTKRLIEALKMNGGSANLDNAYEYLRGEVYKEVLQDRNKLQTPVYFNREWNGPAPVLSVKVQGDSQSTNSGAGGASNAVGGQAINNKSGGKSAGAAQNAVRKK